jgi:hypothetical protein
MEKEKIFTRASVHVVITLQFDLPFYSLAEERL